MKKIIPFCIFFLAVMSFPASAQDQKPDTVKIDPTDPDMYGFVKEQPIKVGEGPANQHAYLRSLRDAQGEPITYRRLGSCCEYASKKGFMGYALLDRYEVTYRDENDEEKKIILYLDFYEYKKPKAVKGFTIKK